MGGNINCAYARTNDLMTFRTASILRLKPIAGSRFAYLNRNGTAEEVSEHEREKMLGLYLDKHPHLVDFVKAPTCALIRMKVDCYYLVSRFQNVVELHITH